MDGDLSKAQVAVVEAILDLHRGNCNIETQGVLVLNPDEPIDKWIYDHDPDEPVNAISLTVMSYEGKRYKCKTPLICKPRDNGVLFCKTCASQEEE